MRDKVNSALEKARQGLASHGGDVDLVDINEETGTVKLRLKGACAGCPMSQITLKNFVEKLIKESVPEINEVIAVE